MDLLFLFNLASKIPGFSRLYKWIKNKRIDRTPPSILEKIKIQPNLENEFKLQVNLEREITIIAAINRVSINFNKGPLLKSTQNIIEPQTISKNENIFSISPNLKFEIINDMIKLSYKKTQILNLEVYQNDKWTKLKFNSKYESIFGLGEKSGTIEKSNRVWRFWNIDNPSFESNDDPLYKSYPSTIIKYKNCWLGLILDFPGFQKWDLSKTSEWDFWIEGVNFSLQILVNDNPESIIKELYSLTGKMELPPLWSLGYHQCRWSYHPKERVLEIVSEFRKRDIPLDAIYLDIDYMDNYRCFTWDPDTFDNPEDFIKLIHSMKCNVVCMIDPGIKVDPKYFVYQEMMEKDFSCTQNDNPFIAPVWPGESVFPDFFDDEVRNWWGTLYAPFIRYGVDGFWNDMNEPSVFTLLGTMPDNIVHNISKANAIPHFKVHNLYGQMMSRASFEGLKKLQPEKRVFLLSRSGYLGSQRFGWIWTGDNKSSWSHLQQSLPKILNSGLAGHFATGADIGGFRGNPTPELYARWIQTGIFYPYCRTHTSKFSDNQEPWSFGSKVESISRKFIKLRYRLLPYTYTWFWFACETGIPLMRPLWLEYPEESNSYENEWVNTQFFFGPSLLIAPILTENDNRNVYLPPGIWYDYFSKNKYQGDNILKFEVYLDDILIFVKDGSIIPHYKKAGDNVEESRNSGLEYKIYGSKCIGHIYLDNGMDLSYKNGNYGFYEIDEKLILTLIQGDGFNQ